MPTEKTTNNKVTDINTASIPEKMLAGVDGNTHFVTVFHSTNGQDKPTPINKHYSYSDGQLHKEVGGGVFKSGHAVCHHVPNLKSLQAVIQEVTQHENQCLSLGFHPMATVGESYKIVSDRTIKGLNPVEGKGSSFSYQHKNIGEPWDDPVYEVVAARTKNTMAFSSYMLVDYDESEQNPETREQLFEQVAEYVPDFDKVDKLFLPSNSKRVGKSDQLKFHLYLEVKNADDLHGIDSRLLTSAQVAGFGWEKESKSGAILQRINIDASVYQSNRLVFDGKPIVIDNDTYIIPDAHVEFIKGSIEKLDTKKIKFHKIESAKFKREKTTCIKADGSTVTRNINRRNESIRDPALLDYSTPIETSNGDIVAMGSIDRDYINEHTYDGKLRVQVPLSIRDTQSMNGIVRIGDKDNQPWLFDNGTGIKYLLPTLVDVFEVFSVIPTEHNQMVALGTPYYGDIVDDYIYIESSSKYLRASDKVILSPDAFIRSHKHIHTGAEKCPLATTIYDGSRNKRVVAGVGWLPINDDIIEFDGVVYANSYPGIQIEAVAGDYSEWFALCELIYGEYTKLVLQHMAFTVQRPLDKIRWQILVYGAKRIGKSLTTLPLKLIFGSACNVIGSSESTEKWGDIYQGNKVLVFEEVYKPDDRVFFNDLKTKLANDDRETLNIKSKGQVVQPNLYSMYLFTNEPDALSFNVDERKLLIIKTPPAEHMWSSQRYRYLADSLNKGQLANHVYDYLLNLNISDFDYGVLPVTTDAAVAMSHASRSDFEHFIIEQEESKQGCFVKHCVKFQELRDMLKLNHYNRGGDKAMRRVMVELGFISCKGQKKINGLPKTIRFWAKSETVKLMSARELYDFYQNSGFLD